MNGWMMHLLNGSKGELVGIFVLCHVIVCYILLTRDELQIDVQLAKFDQFTSKNSWLLFVNKPCLGSVI